MPELFNAAQYLVDGRVEAGDGDRTAVRAPSATLSYRELAEEVRRVAAGLAAIGVRPEERVLFYMVDEVELFTGILGAMYAGAVAVPVSTMLTAGDLHVLVTDSRARVLAGSQALAGTVREAAREAPDLHDVVLTGTDAGGLPDGVRATTWSDLRAGGDRLGLPEAPHATWPESQALWLYTSGTTGKPKGAMHRHVDIRFVCQTYGQQVLGIGPGDVCFSVAKLFFAYGIGNSMFFPLSVGASAVLEPGRATPDGVAEVVAAQRPTLFFGVPTFYAALLSSQIPDDAFASVRQGVSAGEQLPPRLFERMRDRFGVEVLDGIGSTEALHIFLSNYPGQARPGSSGLPVPGYEVEIRDDEGNPVPDGQPGTLYLRGESNAVGYWCRTEASRAVFQGDWLRTGDTYVRNTDGTYSCLGRSDDMLKAGGIWVTPSEVEQRLLEHDAVAEAAVVAARDEDGLDKPVACVVAAGGVRLDPDELIEFCRAGLASFKRPRRVLQIDELPKTATGKIQRFALRELAAEREPVT